MAAFALNAAQQAMTDAGLTEDNDRAAVVLATNEKVEEMRVLMNEAVLPLMKKEYSDRVGVFARAKVHLMGLTESSAATAKRARSIPVVVEAPAIAPEKPRPEFRSIAPV